MQRFFYHVKKAWRQSVLVVCLMGLLSLTNILIFRPQPSFAATSSKASLNNQSETANKYSQANESREDAYEKAVEAIEDPKGIEKIYEENLGVYEEENPSPGIVEEAKNLIKEVTNPGE